MRCKLWKPYQALHRRSCFALLLGLFFFLCIASLYAKDLAWQTLAPGLDERTVFADPDNDFKKLELFRVNLKDYYLEVIPAKSLGLNAVRAQDVLERTPAVLAMNGGFFSPEKNSLGLRVKNGMPLNPLRRISWWSIFYITFAQEVGVLSLPAYRGPSPYRFAIQAGPRLLRNGEIVGGLKNDLAERTAICSTKKGEVILAVTQNWMISTEALAKLLQKPDVACYNAMNLDGGSSSQLYAQIAGLTFNISNFNAVSDVVAVFQK